jgi:acetolactate synthase-1/2/3 large subunit
MHSNGSRATARYADLVASWLQELGYTHCFFVAGGNIMHLLDAARGCFRCVPFLHEVGAGIAAEYFNAADAGGRAFALVTAGPGLTNVVTAMAGAYLESRELLVLGGQVKSSDLASGGIRQRGIQEIDGVGIAAPVSVAARRIERPISRAEFVQLVLSGRTGRKGPVFIELCLDTQGAPVERAALERSPANSPGCAVEPALVTCALDDVDQVAALLARARRPILLIGGGVTRETARAALPGLRRAGIPLQTTWNGIDRVPSDEPRYFGRPNTWGQRFANVLIQQADLVIALGTRLGLQQTGFNWQEFVPLGKVVQVDIDRSELEKGHPRVDLPLHCDANALLRELAARSYPAYDEWFEFCRGVRAALPLREAANVTHDGYVDPYAFYQDLSEIACGNDVVVPCSSGGANSVAMQAFEQRAGQVILTDKGLASMGYGLSGAIGTALAWPERRTICVEGDGGFIQNAQELGTAAASDLNLKIFVMANEGYASIRAMQRNHFGGAYLGCDVRTGLGLPDWPKLFDAFGVPVQLLDAQWAESGAFRRAFEAMGPQAFIVPVDPEQTYYPKITSRITASGGMESNPLHLMTPALEDAVAADVLHYLMQARVAGAAR